MLVLVLMLFVLLEVVLSFCDANVSSCIDGEGAVVVILSGYIEG